MADWRKLAKALALSDGRIDTRETAIIKNEIWSDGKLDKSELEFLAYSSSTMVVSFQRPRKKRVRWLQTLKHFPTRQMRLAVWVE